MTEASGTGQVEGPSSSMMEANALVGATLAPLILQLLVTRGVMAREEAAHIVDFADLVIARRSRSHHAPSPTTLAEARRQLQQLRRQLPGSAASPPSNGR